MKNPAQSIRHGLLGLTFLGSASWLGANVLESLKEPEVPYSDFLHATQSGTVEAINIKGTKITAYEYNGAEFTTTVPKNENVVDRLIDTQVRVHAENPDLLPIRLLDLALYLAAFGSANILNREVLGPLRFKMRNAKNNNSPDEENLLKRTAYHEAGHLLFPLIYPKWFDLKEATIRPGADTLGHVTTKLRSANTASSKTELEHYIKLYLAGMVAEEIALGEKNTSNLMTYDLTIATNTAKDMVTKFGMSSLGPARIYETTNVFDYFTFLGMTIRAGREIPNPLLSPEWQTKVTTEIQSILDRLYKETLVTIQNHKPQLEALAEALLEQETLSAKESRRIFAESIQKNPPLTPEMI